MKRNLIIAFASAIVLTIFAGENSARSGSRSITLRFVPQETTGADYPTFSSGMIFRPLEIVLKDGRPPAERGIVGELSTDDDNLIALHATNDPIDYANEILMRLAMSWGVQVQGDSDLTLGVSLSRFFVMENDLAVGSTYFAEVHLRFILKNREGIPLADGTVTGDARRYGKSRNVQNCNEVLSDALKEAYAYLFNNQDLQDAWSGKGKGGPETGNLITPSDLLAEIVNLKNEGFSTDLLIAYINQRTLRQSMTAKDLSEWKAAGILESIIMEALKKSQSQDQSGNSNRTEKKEQ